MAADILEEHPARPALHDNPADMGPEVAWVAVPEPSPRSRERLARISRSEDVHASAPASAAEGGNVVPDRSSIQGLILHPGHESGRGEGVPFDVTHSPISWLGNVQAELEPADTGAQSETEDIAVGGR